MNKRRAIPLTTRVGLYAEANNRCPFCGNTDVEHLQLHHIDENRSNNERSNLLPVCPTCHSKITKGHIQRSEVEKVKQGLHTAQKRIQLASISVDSTACSWVPHPTVQYSFYNQENGKSPFPILNFTCINHTSDTILFTGIHLRAEFLPSGLSGLPRPQIVRSTCLFRLSIPYSLKGRQFHFRDPIAIPSSLACKFRTLLYEIDEDQYCVPHDPVVLHFTLQFNDTLKVAAPEIFLNSHSRTKGRTLVTIE